MKLRFAQIFESINRFCLRRRIAWWSRPCMKERVLAKGVRGDHVVHIGVWADQGEVKPIPHQKPIRNGILAALW
jgi:hypothetical protein